MAWGRDITLNPTALDQYMPFVPAAIWVYLSAVPLVVVAILIPSARARARAFVAMVIALAVAGVVFLAYPAVIPRHSSEIPGITGMAWTWLYAIDTPRNALPSLHGAFSAVAALALWGEGGGWRVAGAVWFVAVLIAALAVKQHFMWDLAAGVALGFAAYAMGSRLGDRVSGYSGN